MRWPFRNPTHPEIREWIYQMGGTSRKVSPNTWVLQKDFTARIAVSDVITVEIDWVPMQIPEIANKMDRLTKQEQENLRRDLVLELSKHDIDFNLINILQSVLLRRAIPLRRTREYDFRQNLSHLFRARIAAGEIVNKHITNPNSPPLEILEREE